MKWIADKIEHWPTDKLIPYARNARTHSDAQVAQIAASIAEFGFTNPILVGSDGVIIAGHGRLAAAQKLGLEVVPVVVLDHLTPTQRRALVLADNRLALSAGWDEEFLSLELSELWDADYDLTLTGFHDAEIKKLLAGIDDLATADEDGDADGDADADDIAPPKTVTSRPGDIWLLGKHRLICANSSDRQSIARLMDGEKAALLFTSPPYANQRNYTTCGIADWDALMQGVFGAAITAMRDDGQMLVNLGLVHRDNEWQPYWDGWIEWMRQHGWRRFGWYVWDQSATAPGDWFGRLASRHEFIFHFNRQTRKPNKIVLCKTNSLTDGQIQHYRIPDSVITVTRQRGPIDPDREIDHPAVFPLGLPKFVMEAYSNEGEIVFEPFSGSGTTILAGESCGRTVYASELAPEYVDVALIRWIKNHPDVIPVLESTGQTWEIVKTEREPEGVTAAAHADAKNRIGLVFSSRMAKMKVQNGN